MEVAVGVGARGGVRWLQGNVVDGLCSWYEGFAGLHGDAAS